MQPLLAEPYRQLAEAYEAHRELLAGAPVLPPVGDYTGRADEFPGLGPGTGRSRTPRLNNRPAEDVHAFQADGVQAPEGTEPVSGEALALVLSRAA